ncbi:hypothetical protein FHS76_000779 [Ochrobactrum daejeonense]|uniref:Uncharacterized protein n=1 Tax=Brucella daejeonensis TaxID=659015 RepID=A0A7W9ELP8_9HYPH|nr:hypothetical protein [Brucella daejeonensis]
MSRARFDLVHQIGALILWFHAHLIRKPFHTFRDAF